MMKATSPAAKSSPNQHRGDERDGNQNVRLDVKGGDQPDDGLQDDGDAAQDDGDPGHIEGEGVQVKDAQQQGKSGKNQKSDVPFGAAPLEQLFQLLHGRCLLDNTGRGIGIFCYQYTGGGICLSRGKRKNSCIVQLFGRFLLDHVCKSLDGLGEVGDGLVGVAVLDAVADTVVDVPFQNDLSDLVQGGLGGVDLGEDVLAGDVLIDHAVDGLHLSDNFFQAAV